MRIVAVLGRDRALEMALGLGEVTALAMLPPDDEGLLRAARGAGAVRAVAVWDDALRDTDYFGAAQTLAAAIDHLGGEVVLCGDAPCGLLAPAIADRLGVPHLSGVVSAEWRDGALVAARPSGGRLHLLSAHAPLVIGVAGTALPPPASDEFEVERLQLSQVGIAPAELRWRRRFLAGRPAAVRQAPSAAPGARPLALPDAAALVARLRGEGLLPTPPDPSRGAGDDR